MTTESEKPTSMSEPHAQTHDGELALIGERALAASLWATRPVAEQPELTLRQWSIRQLPGGDRHFVGWCVETSEGRVSSKVVSFNPGTLRGVTATGRVYRLSGPPGYHGDAEYTWHRWRKTGCATTFEDVTAAVIGGSQ